MLYLRGISESREPALEEIVSDLTPAHGDLVPLTVTVPRHTIPDLYTFVASLHVDDDEPPTVTEEEATGKDAPKKRAAAGFGAATVRKNYLGGVSDYWRPFLEQLATHPDQWLAWQELCEAIDMTPRQASGMLGAAERRCKQLPPYEKAYEDGEHWFRMPKDVAEVVQELAKQG